MSLLVAWAVGCSDGGGTSTSSSTSSTSGGTTFTLSPTSADLATCRSQVFTAAPSDGVMWSLAGEGKLTEGTYAAPISVPSPASATITATRGADTASATVTLATAFPEAGIDVARVSTSTVPDHVRAVASHGKRAYALVEQDTNLDKNSLSVARSDDGGLTWGMPTALPGGVNSPAIAMDAGDDDTVYVTIKQSDGGAVGTLVLAVSTDGAKTFTTHPLFVGGTGEANDADVVSPAPGHVVVTAPATWQDNGNGPQGMTLLVWHDAKKGAGFGGLVPLDNGYDASWSPGIDHRLADGHLVETNSSRGGPNFATNGKGALCLVTNDYDINGSGEVHQVMCSTDNGGTFGAPVNVVSGKPSGQLRSRIAMGPDGKLVVVAWNAFATDVDTIGTTTYAVSTDGGATFDAPHTLGGAATGDGQPAGVSDVEVAIDEGGVIWFARTVNDANPIEIDKSCDQGKTLSGALRLSIAGPNAFFFGSSAGWFGGSVRVGATDVGLTAVRLIAP